MNTLNNFKQRIQSIRDFWRRNSVLLLTIVVTVFCITGMVYFFEDIWNWSARITENPNESNSAILRNLVLIIAPVVALILALWRLSIADRQSKIAQQHLHNDRYQNGIDMLVDPSLTIRLGGIASLQNLSLESMENHHLQIMGLFSHFVRYPPRFADDEPDPILFEHFERENLSYNTQRVDIQTILEYLGQRGNKEREFEKLENYILDFRHVDLSFAYILDSNWSSTNFSSVILRNAVIIECNLKNAVMSDANLFQTQFKNCILTKSILHYANMKNTFMIGCDLRNAKFDCCNMVESVLFKANLQNAILYKSDLSGANFMGANLSGADLSDVNLRNAKNLTQPQIDQALAKLGNPPDLTGLNDCVTGKPLVWKN